MRRAGGDDDGVIAPLQRLALMTRLQGAKDQFVFDARIGNRA